MHALIGLYVYACSLTLSNIAFLLYALSLSHGHHHAYLSFSLHYALFLLSRALLFLVGLWGHLGQYSIALVEGLFN